MWLLNTETLKLEEHVDPSTIQYAILSHTWEDDEVSFRDISDLDLARSKAGFAKIAKTCELARLQGIGLAWVDTCCIDKSSSAELSEAINSMFQWYKLSNTCYVYLSDLTIAKAVGVDDKAFQDAFAHCRWFTRGWTLQELIAPRRIGFFNASWDFIGTKYRLLGILEKITRIPRPVLLDSSALRSTIVAVKMSWAVQRQTKRVEDRAYSLLGIFDINMPLIYGEGSKAFRRLQEEIAKETNDPSLFAWRSLESTLPTQDFRGILADSPDEFSGSSDLDEVGPRREFSLTNKGVRFETFLYKCGSYIYAMPLGLINDNLQRFVGLYLVCTADGFVRCRTSRITIDEGVMKSSTESGFSTIFVRKAVTEEESSVLQTRRHRSFTVRNRIPKPLSVKSLEPYPSHLWENLYGTFISDNPSGDFLASMRITVQLAEHQSNEEFPLVVYLGHSNFPTEFASAYVYGYGGSTPSRLVQNGALGGSLPFGLNPPHRSTVPQTFVPFARYFLFSLHKLTWVNPAHGKEVLFWDVQSLSPRTGEVQNTAHFVRFGVQLERKTSSEGIVTFEVSLTGEVSEMELGKAVKMIREVVDLPQSSPPSPPRSTEVALGWPKATHDGFVARQV